MSADIKFTFVRPAADRVYHVSKEDILVLIDRLPPDVRGMLRVVHFNDRSRGARILGYVGVSRREISLCALPPRLSLTRALVKGQEPETFGARAGSKWPTLAVRRFLLYDVFLHELGHLQIVDEKARTWKQKFAGEKYAQEFGMDWCRRLWSKPFDHPDPVHNPPSRQEIESLGIH
jgi:hypothetical protein